ncbi:hypothetical protein GMPD_43390 [Geomonas paludis]|uniref:Uncharacterized protein n=1 Tax=Geomonas paludis TaxID=2740185 RepID=A0A6V8N229_9BACT|nr:hypothetical protein GMPD_43390 [Geomonas paludis]
MHQGQLRLEFAGAVVDMSSKMIKFYKPIKGSRGSTFGMGSTRYQAVNTWRVTWPTGATKVQSLHMILPGWL